MTDTPLNSKAKRAKDPDYKDLYRAENGNYYIRYWSPKLKRELEYSLKTEVRGRAIRERKRILEDLQSQKTRQAVKFKRFHLVVGAFKESVTFKKKYTQKSFDTQVNKHILPNFGMEDPALIDNQMWISYAMKRRAEDPACSLHNVRKYLCKILNWAFEKRIVDKKFKPDDFDVHRPKIGTVIERKDLEKVLSFLNDDWRDIVELSWEMGFRVGEVKNLEWNRVRFQTREVHFDGCHTKTKRAKTPVMTEKAFQIFTRRRMGLSGHTPWVFPGIDPRKAFSVSDQAWQLAKRKAKVKFRFHDIRHTWLTNAFRSSHRYAEICAYAGLSLDEALKTYVKFNHSDMSAIAALSL